MKLKIEWSIPDRQWLKGKIDFGNGHMGIINGMQKTNKQCSFIISLVPIYVDLKRKFEETDILDIPIHPKLRELDGAFLGIDGIPIGKLSARINLLEYKGQSAFIGELCFYGQDKILSAVSESLGGWTCEEAREHQKLIRSREHEAAQYLKENLQKRCKEVFEIKKEIEKKLLGK